MNKWTISMYGIPREISEKREVEVELRDGAGMSEVVAALRKKVPGLEGRAIVAGENRLADEYKFNINGNFYYAGTDFKLKKGDRIALLVPMTGG